MGDISRAIGCTVERVLSRDGNRGEKREEFKVAKSEEAGRLPKTGDPPPPTEEPCLRERLWTLPRYTGRGERDRPKEASPPPLPPTVEVFVSHHGGGRGGSGGGGALGVQLSSASPAADDRKTTPVAETAADPRSSAKTATGRQLEPVYETKSYDDASAGSRNASRTATGSGTTTAATGSGGGGGGRMSAAAESVSAKLTGLLGSLLGGPKRQPLRSSTSYSNVSAGGGSSSRSPSSSLASLPPPLAAEERTTSVSSGSLQTSASGTSLSTTRPLRIYTRSSTDTEIYRTRQDSTRQAAGRSALLLHRRPDPKS